MQENDDQLLEWTSAPRTLQRTRRVPSVLAAVLLAVICTSIGILIGRFSVGKTPREPIAVGAAPASKDNRPQSVSPDLAITGAAELAEKTTGAPTDQAKSKGGPGPVVILNPGTADRKSLAPERVSRRFNSQPPRRQSADRDDGIEAARPATESERNYHALRDYMLSR